MRMNLQFPEYFCEEEEEEVVGYGEEELVGVEEEKKSGDHT